MKKFRYSAVIIALSALTTVSCSKSESTAEPQKCYYRAANTTSSPSLTTVFEYTPAPGQFINTSDVEITTPEGATQFAEDNLLKKNTFVSLGGFGGYIVVGFDHSIPNRKVFDGLTSEYDFSVKGNPFKDSSEPGIVYVMMDEDGDGNPNNTWYELKGAEYDAATTIRDYAVTYNRPSEDKVPITWSDNKGNLGLIDYQGLYHSQLTYFPTWIDKDSYTLTGVRLESNLTQSQTTNLWASASYGWGYADNMGDDFLYPLTSKATNGFKISNAVDETGASVVMSHVDFIKIQCAVNDQSPSLGEISTEVFGFTDMHIAQ